MVKISICGGGNCEMNGSYETMDAFIKAAKELGRSQEIVFTKAFCMGECSNGPCVRIDGVKFRRVHSEDVPELMLREVLPRLESSI